MRPWALAMAVLWMAGPAAAEPGPDADPPADASAADDLLLLPEFTLDYEPGDPIVQRGALRTVNESWSLVNETVSDAWNITSSPLDWRAREWAVFFGVAATTAGLIYMADGAIRDEARQNERFGDFGDEIQFLGRGTALVAVTGGFLVSGIAYRDKEIRTAKMLIEASAIGQGYSVLLKRSVGRKRPGRLGPRYFDPWNDEFSLPSGEVTNAFAAASVVSGQYPYWPVWLLSYGAAATIGAGRIATDDHWTSDVFLGAALGVFIGRSVVYFHHERARRADERRRLGLEKEPYRPRHFLAVSTRGFRWTVQF